jgi:hypothetical protein
VRLVGRHVDHVAGGRLAGLRAVAEGDPAFDHNPGLAIGMAVEPRAAPLEHVLEQHRDLGAVLVAFDLRAAGIARLPLAGGDDLHQAVCRSNWPLGENRHR